MAQARVLAAISFIKESEYEKTYQLKSNSFLGTTRNFSFRGRIGSALLKINSVFLHRNVICHLRDISKISFCITHLDQTGKWKHFLFHVPTSSQNVCVFHLWTSGSTGRYLSAGSVKRKFLSFEEKLTSFQRQCLHSKGSSLPLRNCPIFFRPTRRHQNLLLHYGWLRFAEFCSFRDRGDPEQNGGAWRFWANDAAEEDIEAN